MENSEQIYRQIFAAIPEGLMLLNIEAPGLFRVADVNETYERISGNLRAQCVGKFLHEIVTDEIREPLLSKCQHCVDTGDVITEELAIETPHGPRVYHTALTPVRAADNHIRRLAIITRDITAAHRLETVLQERAEEFRALTENAVDFITRYDVDGRVLYANPTVLQWAQRPPEQLIGKSTMDLVPNNPTALIYHNALIDAVRTGQPVELETRIEGLEPNTPRYHDIRFAPERDSSGRVVSVLGIGRDVSRLKEVENQLRQREAEFRTLAENSPDIIMRFDREGRYLYVSPAIETATGLPASNFIGTKVQQQQHSTNKPTSLMRMQRAIERVFEDGIPRQIELDEEDSPERRTYDLRLVPERDANGTLRSVLGIARDVTEQKAAAAALEKLNITLETRVAARTAALESANRDLESFAYTVSHDLRAPLRVINGYAAALMEDEGNKLSGQGRDMLKRISQAGITLTRLIDDILEYSRSGASASSYSLVAMEGLAVDVANELRPAHPRVQIAIGSLPNAVGDPTMLRQILQNLVANACKFSTVVASPRVEIGWYPLQDGRAVYFVRDNGIGFEMRNADNLFGMFQRLHPDQEFPGTGVGLAIVKRLVERHGGRIWAQGQVGQGATFFFSLGGGNGVEELYQAVSPAG